MKKQDEFYIGWQENMPEATKGFLKKIIIGGSLFLIALAVTVVLLQKPFNSYVFEFGQVKNFTGTYYSDPQPLLLVAPDQVPEGSSNSLLLIGYGKFGAEGILKNIETQHGPLSGQQVTLSGTLIYGDEKTLLELSNKEASYIEKVPGSSPASTQTTNLKEITVSGEIIDPKCYFGVMKPGEGKIHKSCAIRCISGGIPPVIRHNTGNTNKPYQYFILLDKEGLSINKAMLPYVAEQVIIKGQTRAFFDWDILYIDTDQIERINKTL